MADSIVFSEYIEAGPKLLKGTGLIQATFRATPLHVTVANTIRRQILAAVETVGFKTEPPESSDVHIHVNTTPLVNEMLMHRIGMIPIAVTEPSTFNPAEYEFRMNIENIGDKPVNVTAADIRVFKISATGEEELPNADFFPVDTITGDAPLITVLRPKYNLDSIPEKLSLTAKASVGTGRQNMRYSSVAQCSYEYTPDNNPSRQLSIRNNWLATSKKVPDPAGITPERLAELTREFNCLEVQRCYLENEKGEPYDFLFHIESVGILSVPIIVERGLKSCEDIVTPYLNFDTEFPVNDKGQAQVAVQKAARRMENGYEFVFQNEEHTLGNLLQTFLVERHINGTEKPKLLYAGYKVPHPLRAEMVLIVSSEDGLETTAREAIANTCQYLKVYFNNVAQSWLGTPKVATAAKANAKSSAANAKSSAANAETEFSAAKAKKRTTKK